MSEPPEEGVGPPAGVKLPSQKILNAPKQVAKNREPRPHHEVLTLFVESEKIQRGQREPNPPEGPERSAWFQNYCCDPDPAAAQLCSHPVSILTPASLDVIGDPFDVSGLKL